MIFFRSCRLVNKLSVSTIFLSASSKSLISISPPKIEIIQSFFALSFVKEYFIEFAYQLDRIAHFPCRKATEKFTNTHISRWPNWCVRLFRQMLIKKQTGAFVRNTTAVCAKSPWVRLYKSVATSFKKLSMIILPPQIHYQIHTTNIHGYSHIPCRTTSSYNRVPAYCNRCVSFQT